MKTYKIILGLGYGDEGKGRTVDYFADNKTVVVRFNGGHQVGHTVVKQGRRHVFSSFCAGTFQGAITYTSHYCTVHPTGFLNEMRLLNQMSVSPNVVIHPEAMITTPWDINANKLHEASTQHGSVTVGFGKTIERNKKGFKIFARDLFYPKILAEKLKLLNDFYDLQLSKYILQKFLAECVELTNHIILRDYDYLKGQDVIFEGAQGILLDMDYGFFPHVTYSNTTSKNAIDIISRIADDEYKVEKYYVTRPYQTRHGAGPLTNSEHKLHTRKITNETNVTNAQGPFRKSILDVDMLHYALACDKQFESKYPSDKILVFTCLDQIAKNKTFRYTLSPSKTIGIADVKDIADMLGIYTIKIFKSEEND